MNTFGPELDAELAYRREMLMRRPIARRTPGAVSRLLRRAEGRAVLSVPSAEPRGPRPA
jgi:hypothetical protein